MNATARLSPLVPCLVLLAFASPPARAEEATYVVTQKVTLGPLDAGHKNRIDWWISIPGDAAQQDLLDITVTSAPGEWTIVREPEYGNRFLHVQVNCTDETSLEAVVDFKLRRRAAQVRIDPAKVGELTTASRAFFARELAQDSPHMEATDEIRRIANEACGQERNIARQARLLLDKVAELADHYSKDPSKPSCGIGDAGACMKQGGGCCTDLHSLFIALARAREIPARLQMGYRLLGKNDGKWVDPGYRCWVEYFVPGYGWVPADIVEADAPGGLGKDTWFSGLTVERLWLNEGRDFLLPGDPTPKRVNHMSHGYAEVDGRPIRLLPEGELPMQISRKIHFQTIQQGK